MSISSIELWIGFPLLLGLALFTVSTWRNFSYPAAIAVCALLVVGALLLPFDEVHTLGTLSLKIIDNYQFFDLELTLPDPWRPILAGLYALLGAVIWGGQFSKSARRFPGLALALTALLLLSFTPQPYHLGIIPIQFAIVLAVALLLPYQKIYVRGIVRMFNILILATPLLLFSGWMLAGVEVNPGTIDRITSAGALLGLGLWILLGIFPFHHWVPLVLESRTPYLSTFVVLIFQGMFSLFALTLLDQFSWIRETEEVYIILRALGTLMVLYSGIWLIFEKHLGRMLGFAILLDGGMLLAALGLGAAEGLPLFFAMLLPRIVSSLVWAGVLQWLTSQAGAQGLTVGNLRGLLQHYPLAVILLLGAFFSMAGLPGFSGFPLRLALWEKLAVQALPAAGLTLLGNLGMLLGGVKILRSMLAAPSEEDTASASPAQPPTNPLVFRQQRAPLWIATGVLIGFSVLFGLFPQWFVWVFDQYPLIFENFIN